MVSVVQAPCPSCQRVLRIPSDWVSQPMRCKHCGMVFQATARPQAFVPANPTPAATVASIPPVVPPAHGDDTFAFGGDAAVATLPRSRRRSGATSRS